MSSKISHSLAVQLCDILLHYKHTHDQMLIYLVGLVSDLHLDVLGLDGVES